MPPAAAVPTWADRVTKHRNRLTASEAQSVFDANREMIARVLRGMGPDKPRPDPDVGARVVMNIPAVHVPSFCDHGYKNSYDLGAAKTLGELLPGSPIPTRTLVDDILKTLTGRDAKEIYFGALEVNGTGVRFYGDVCLVLKTDDKTDTTIILNSNSYDLVRPPVTEVGNDPDRSNLERHVLWMKGLWGDNKGHMAFLKMIARLDPTSRRFTTGQISEAVLNDEDYLEVLKIDSFNAGQLQEARLSASDVAAESQVAERLRLGPPPSLAELQWRKHRRAASAALRMKALAARIVTTSGRVRQ